MYIDNPHFPRRKVAIGKDIPSGGYVYGLQRQKLANFVNQALNQGGNKNAQILQKFRKQAEDYKKKKLHKNHKFPISSPTKSEGKFSANNLSPISQLKLPTSQSAVMNTYKQIEYEQPKQSGISRAAQKIILREIGMTTDSNYQQFLKSLKQRDKKIKKQAVLIKKNQERMRKMHERIIRLQMQNQYRDRQKSFDKIKQLLSSVSQRVDRQQYQISKSKITTPPIQRVSTKLIAQQNPQNSDYLNIPLSQSKQFSYRRVSPPKMVQHQKHMPKINYNYTVQQNNKNQSIHEYIADLNRSRNRLDAYALT